MADAGPMLNRCFELQHPEAFGRAEVLPPSGVYFYGRDSSLGVAGEHVTPEQMGNPEARPLDELPVPDPSVE